MVQTVPGNTWIDGGEENVAVAKTIHYTADEVKAGDYIYSGRSTSYGVCVSYVPQKQNAQRGGGKTTGCHPGVFGSG